MAWIVGKNIGDNILGTSSRDNISGLGGDDYIDAGGGNDEVSGDSGNDTIYGGAGDDRIVGGTGNDHIVGGEGRDQLWGCQGADTFVYLAASDSPVTAKDSIKDLDRHDVIDLSALNLTGGFIGNLAFSGLGQGEVRFVPVSSGAGRGVIEADVNGDGATDLAIDVFGSGVPLLTASDFIL
jgi:serralysin